MHTQIKQHHTDVCRQKKKKKEKKKESLFVKATV